MVGSEKSLESFANFVISTAHTHMIGKIPLSDYPGVVYSFLFLHHCCVCWWWAGAGSSDCNLPCGSYHCTSEHRKKKSICPLRHFSMHPLAPPAAAAATHIPPRKPLVEITNSQRKAVCAVKRTFDHIATPQKCLDFLTQLGAPSLPTERSIRR